MAETDKNVKRMRTTIHNWCHNMGHRELETAILEFKLDDPQKNGDIFINTLHLRPLFYRELARQLGEDLNLLKNAMTQLRRIRKNDEKLEPETQKLDKKDVFAATTGKKDTKKKVLFMLNRIEEDSELRAMASEILEMGGYVADSLTYQRTKLVQSIKKHMKEDPKFKKIVQKYYFNQFLAYIEDNKEYFEWNGLKTESSPPRPGEDGIEYSDSDKEALSSDDESYIESDNGSNSDGDGESYSESENSNDSD